MVPAWPPTNQPVQIYRYDPDTLAINVGSNMSRISNRLLTKDQTIALDEALLATPGSTESTPKKVLLAGTVALKSEEVRFK